MSFAKSCIQTAEVNVTAFDFVVKNAKGEDVDLNQYKGRCLLVVNVASACGFTPQYKGLQELYEKYRDQGLTILGFPCNQFGSQESRSNDEIQEFCETRFSIQFPVLAKIEVNGTDADPLFQFLKKEAPGVLGTQAIKWNFTKFLVDREGRVVGRYAPNTQPSEIEADILKTLGL